MRRSTRYITPPKYYPHNSTLFTDKLLKHKNMSTQAGEFNPDVILVGYTEQSYFENSNKATQCRSVVKVDGESKYEYKRDF